MRLLHFADQHANSNLEKYIKSLNQIKEFVAEEKNHIDAILSAGDLFNSRVSLAEEANYIINSFVELADLKPVFMVYGTPSHDYRGSLDILPKLNTTYPIEVVDKIDNKMYYLSESTKGFLVNECDNKNLGGCYIFGVPWIMRSRVLTDDELKLSISEQEKIFKVKFEKWVEWHREFKKGVSIPVIMVAHLQLNGSVFSKSQDITSENHDPAWFYDICDYGALGHVHKTQNFKHLHYSGSIYNKTWGEMENKYFKVITIQDSKIVDVEVIMFDTPALIKADLGSFEEYEEFKRDFAENISDTEISKAELWINLTLKDKKAFNLEKDLTFWKKVSILENVRFDVSEMKVQSQHRIEGVKENMSLVERAVLWANLKGIRLSEFQKQRIIKLEEVE